MPPDAPSLFLELEMAAEDEFEDEEDVEDDVDFEDFSLYMSRSFEAGVLLAPLLCFSLCSFEDEPLTELDDPPPPPDDLLEPFEFPPLDPIPDVELALED